MTDRLKIDTEIDWYDADSSRLHKIDSIGRKLCTESGWVYETRDLKPPCKNCIAITRRKTHTKEWNAIWLPKYFYSYSELITVHVTSSITGHKAICGQHISRSTVYSWAKTKRCLNCLKMVRKMTDEEYAKLPKRMKK